MKFDAVTIKNFRNFEYIAINLTNKNVLFGMNDVGKTNFLYALRFLFDKDIRKYSSDRDTLRVECKSAVFHADFLLLRLSRFSNSTGSAASS